MQFLKLESNFSQDVKVKKLMRKHGYLGYAVYVHTLELITSEISKDNVSCELPEAAETIAFDFREDVETIEEVLKTCIETGLFEGKEKETISCKKILKRLNTNELSTSMRTMVYKATKENDDNVTVTTELSGDNVTTTTEDCDSVTKTATIDIRNKNKELRSKNLELDKDIRIKNKELNLNTHDESSENLCVPNSNSLIDEQPEGVQEYARQVFEIWADCNLPCPSGGYLSFLQRDFKQALPYLHSGNYHSSEIIAACENYAKVIALKRKNQTWWSAEQTFDNFAKNTVKRFLPEYFRISDYENMTDKAKNPVYERQML